MARARVETRREGYTARVRTSISAVGAASPAVCWERYADLDRWSAWAPQITGVDAPERRLRAGLRGRVRAAGLLRIPFEVIAVDEQARTWSWRVALGPVRLRRDHGVEAAPEPEGEPSTAAGPGTRTWLVTTGPAPVVAPYTPIALVALHSLLLDRPDR